MHTMDLFEEGGENAAATRPPLKLTLPQTTQLVLPSNGNGELLSPKLSEPRHLFSLQLGPQQAPRWPAECQMPVSCPQHITVCPPERESYYQASGTEPEPAPWGDKILSSGGELIYYYPLENSAPYFTRSSTANGLAPAEDNRFLTSPDSLVFESRFESGNLAKAVKIAGNFYELYLRPDLYTSRHVQWFYFSIRNMQPNTTYRFSIVNFTKVDSLYCEGLKPLMYSDKVMETTGIGWHRCGSKIAYFRNEPEKESATSSHTLSFTLKFPYADDTVYLSYCYPYTYSFLQDYLSHIQNDAERSQYCKIRLLCRSLAGNTVHVLTITSPTKEDTEKSGIVLTARVHPGETPSSWIMHGVLDFLTGPSACARELREKFIFKIVPMLNPDGVIVGNTRCSLAARDLNRQYRVVSRECFPSVWHVKMLVRKFIEERPVVFYCDFHSHSRKHNIFLYGCENKEANECVLLEQVFPLMMHRASKGMFEFENCKFVIQRAKEGTGRVVMKQLGILHSYTLEASVCGTLIGTNSTQVQTHFNIADLKEMGEIFCQTLAEFFDQSPSRTRWINRALRYLAAAKSTAEEPVYVHVNDDDSSDDEKKKRSSRCFQSRRFSLLVNSSNRNRTDFLKVARCITQLNVRMSRLGLGESSRSRSNSYSSSPSRSSSLNVSLSASTSPRRPRLASSTSPLCSEPPLSARFGHKAKEKDSRCSDGGKMTSSCSESASLRVESIRNIHFAMDDKTVNDHVNKVQGKYRSSAAARHHAKSSYVINSDNSTSSSNINSKHRSSPGTSHHHHHHHNHHHHHHHHIAQSNHPPAGLLGRAIGAVRRPESVRSVPKSQQPLSSKGTKERKLIALKGGGTDKDDDSSSSSSIGTHSPEMELPLSVGHLPAAKNALLSAAGNDTFNVSSTGQAKRKVKKKTKKYAHSNTGSTSKSEQLLHKSLEKVGTLNLVLNALKK